MYPEHGSFTVLVILGRAELAQALDRIETFGPLVQQALMESPRYHDGCWMYIRVADPTTCQQDVLDIEQLILIKIGLTQLKLKRSANRAVVRDKR